MKRLILISTLVALFTTSMISLALASWMHPSGLADSISPADGDMEFVRTAMDNNGNAIVVWKKSDVYREVYMSEYRNGVWSHPADLSDFINLTGTSTEMSLTLAMADNGDAVIVWNQHVGGTTFKLFKSERRNGVWSHPKSLADGFGPDGISLYDPQVAMDANGNTIIVWRQHQGSTFQMYKSEYRNNSWTHPTDLSENFSPSTQNVFNPQVAMDDNGNAIITWNQGSGSAIQIYMSEYRNNTWTHPSGLSEYISLAGQPANHASVAMDNNGNAIIAWRQKNGAQTTPWPDIQIYKSEYRNGSWTHPGSFSESISPDGSYAYEHTLAMDNTGNAIISWYQWNSDSAPSGGNQVFKSEYRNGAWTHPADIADYISPSGASVDATPHVGMDDNGNAIIAWRQSDGTNNQVFKSEYRNGAWSHPASISENISPDESSVSTPRLAMDNNDNAIIAWYQSDGTDVQVYISEYRLPPTVATNVASSVGYTSATLNGAVNANYVRTAVTFEYGADSNYGNTVTAEQSPLTDGGDTLVTKSISGLTPNTTYHFRVAATSNAGAGNGADQTFTTPPKAPTVTTNAATAVGALSATLNGIVNANNSDTTVTFEYGTDTNYGSSVTAGQSPVSGLSDTAVSQSISGLAADTTYHFRVVGQNTGGVSNGADRTFKTGGDLAKVNTGEVTSVTKSSASAGGDVTDDGGPPVTARGVCWATTQNPQTSDSKTNDGAGTGTFTSAITGLSSNTTYYVRAYAINSLGTAYGEQAIFRTAARDGTLPTVTTSAVSSVTSATAQSGGNVTSNGGASVTARGVCWATSQNPTISGTKTRDSDGTGEFTSAITGLDSETTYYVRAYAVNSAGVAYGEQVSFTTASLPTVTGFSPDSGVAGDTVAIHGTGFTNVAQVSFGGTAAQSYTVDSATHITATVGNGTTGRVSVAAANGVAVSQDSFTYSGVATAPSITRFTPESAAKNNIVRIFGANFSDVSAVTFGGVPAGSFDVVSEELITARMGSGATGPVQVTAQAGAAVSATPIYYTGEALLHLVFTHTENGRLACVSFSGCEYASTAVIKESFLSAANQGRTINDFTLDGKDDVILFDSETRETCLCTLNDGFTVGEQRSLDIPIPAPWEVAASGDFNADEVTDIVCKNMSTGEIAVIFLSADFTKVGIQKLDITLPLEWRLVAAGDMNKDGVPDLVFQSAAGPVGVVYVGENFTRASATMLDAPIPPSWRVAGLSDFNNNDVLDLVLYNAAQSGVSVLYLTKDFSADGFSPVDKVGSWAENGWGIVSTGDIY